MGARTGKEFLEGLARRPRGLARRRAGSTTSPPSPACAGAARHDGRALRPPARAARRAADGRRRDRRAGRRQPPHPAVRRRPAAPPRRPRAHRPAHRSGCSAAPPTTSTSRSPASPAGPTSGRRTATSEGAENLVRFQREAMLGDCALTHTIVHPTVDKAAARSTPATARSSSTRSARRPTASSCAAPACWPRSPRSPTRCSSTPASRFPATPPRYALVVLGADDARRASRFLCRDSYSPAATALRPPVLEPLRRAGRVRHLRRRRGAARARVHRRRHRDLQPGR